MSERVPIRVWVILSAGLAVLGTSAILIRFADSAPGLSVATWRTVFAALLLLPHTLARSVRDLRNIAPKDFMLIGVAGVLLGMHFIAWIESLYHTSVASASVLVTTSPLFIAILGLLFLRERVGWKTFVAILTAIGGAVLIGFSDTQEGTFPNAMFGNTLAMSAALFFAIYILIGRAIRQRTTFLAYTAPLYVVAAFTCLLIALVQGVPLAQPPTILGLCLLMALGPQLLGHGAFNYAVRYLPASLIGILSLTEPIGASVLALVIFGELPKAMALFGMLVVLASIGAVLAQRSRKLAE